MPDHRPPFRTPSGGRPSGAALSDEAIHALVDGEYSPEDRLAALEAIAADPALGHAVCELHRLKALVRTAYDDVTPPERPSSDAGRIACGLRARGNALRWGAARARRMARHDAGRPSNPREAGGAPDAFGVVGMTAAARRAVDRRPGRGDGWARYFGNACARYAAVAAITGAVTAVIATATLGSRLDAFDPGPQAAVATPSERVSEQPVIASAGMSPSDDAPRAGVAKAFDAPVTAETQQILLHLTESDPTVMADLLADVERLLREGERLGQDLRVQVVTNAGGLNLLRADRSPFADRIAALQAAFPQLRFVACESTIDDHQRAEGRRPPLLPNVVSIDSGVAEVARRQREGWVYIRV